MKIKQMGVRITAVSGLIAIEVQPSNTGDPVNIKVWFRPDWDGLQTFSLSTFKEVLSAFQAAQKEAQRIADTIDETALSGPEQVTDRAGDIWYRAPNGFYITYHPGHPEHENACWPLERIRAEYGIKEEKYGIKEEE